VAFLSPPNGKTTHSSMNLNEDHPSVWPYIAHRPPQNEQPATSAPQRPPELLASLMRTPKLQIVVSAILMAGTVACSKAPEAASPPPASSTVGTIDRLDPGLDALLAPTATIEKVAGGFKFLEGPL
jgi:hypothetical protein